MSGLVWRRSCRPLLCLRAALSGKTWRSGTSPTRFHPVQRRCCCGAAPDAASVAGAGRSASAGVADTQGASPRDAAGRPDRPGASREARWEEWRGPHLEQTASPQPQASGRQQGVQGLHELTGGEGRRGNGAVAKNLSAAPLTGSTQPKEWQEDGGACEGDLTLQPGDKLLTPLSGLAQPEGWQEGEGERASAGPQDAEQRGQWQDGGRPSGSPAGSSAAGRAELLETETYDAARAWREQGFGGQGGQRAGSGVGGEDSMSAGSSVGRGRGPPTVSGFQPALDRLLDRVKAQGRSTERQEYLVGFGRGAAAAGSDDKGLWDPEEGGDGEDTPGGAEEGQEYLRGFRGGEVGDVGEELWEREEGSDEDAEGVFEEESEDEAPATAGSASAEADAKVRAAAEARPWHV